MNGVFRAIDQCLAAASGLLHSHTGEPKRHRELKVRKLLYHRLVNGKRIGIIQLRMDERFSPPNIAPTLAALSGTTMPATEGSVLRSVLK